MTCNPANFQPKKKDEVSETGRGAFPQIHRFRTRNTISLKNSKKKKLFHQSFTIVLYIYQEKTTTIRLPPDELFRLTQLAVEVADGVHIVAVANAALI